MKKLFFYAALFAAGFAVTSCSSDKEVVASDNGQVPNGESYICLSLQLPTTSATTRANDTFDDGLAIEYKVKDATLVLFEGTAENTAVYSGNYDLNLSWALSGTTTDQITTTAQIVQKVDNRTSSTNNFYAYVVLNKPTSLATILSSATKGTSTFNQMFGTTATLSTTNLTETVDGTDHFIPMTNAPLAKYAGGSAAPTDGTYSILSKIDKDLIFATEIEAKNHAATSVYVERMYSKVTVANGSANKLQDANGDDITNSSSTTINYTVSGWTLDNTNKSAYFQRQLDGTFPNYTWYNYYSNHASVTGANVYRFAGSNEVASGKGYRIYWALDPNYNSFTPGTFNAATVSNVSGSLSNPQYCYENTFNVANQKEQSTTRALVKVVFNNGSDFYAINDDPKTFYDENGIKGKVIEFLMDDPTIRAAATAASLTTPTVANSSITLDIITDPSKVTVSTTLTLSDGTNSLNCSTYASIINAMFNHATNPTKRIRFYDDGLAYYPILIKHFGDDQCYWASTEHLSQTSYADEGTAPVSRYLGRYGVLRNNWYHLNITKISNLGLPNIPTLTDDDDDKVKSYISVQINILSWAKRTQDVTL